MMIFSTITNLSDYLADNSCHLCCWKLNGKSMTIKCIPIEPFELKFVLWGERQWMNEWIIWMHTTCLKIKPTILPKDLVLIFSHEICEIIKKSIGFNQIWDFKRIYSTRESGIHVLYWKSTSQTFGNIHE